MKYCFKCGSQMKRKKADPAYDRYTGKLLGYWYKVVCPKWWLLHNSDVEWEDAPK